MALGLQSDGSMEVPPGAFPAGWYSGSPTPGELGPAVIAGHVQYNEDEGVFADLSSLDAGDTITVTRDDGTAAVFEVTSVEEFAQTQFPTDRVYGNIDHAGLRLITCDGLDAESGDYGCNLVVFGELVRSA